MLDIKDVQPGQTVHLRLFGKLSDTRASSVTTAIAPLSTTAWTETTVTWNNKPAAGADTWATVAVSGTTAQWYEIDVTPHVQALRAAGQTSVAIALTGTADTLPYATFSARESVNAPRLVITP
jgi:endoglucanase